MTVLDSDCPVVGVHIIKWDSFSFQGIMLFLQNLPTKHWKNDDISLLLAEAYSLKYMFADAPKHLGQQKKR